jgi:hypothetical protein
VERSAKLVDAISILGVPVPVVEIQVSLKKKIAWIVLVNRERKSASKDFPLDAWLSLGESARTVENLGKDLIKAMGVSGLIDDASRVTVIDLDSQPVQ